MMSLSKLMSNVFAELRFLEETRQITLSAYSPVVSNVSFFRVDDKPGFFTPWWEKTSENVNMGYLAALQDLVITAGINLLLVGKNILRLIVLPFSESDEFDHTSKTERWFAAPFGILLYAAVFLVDLVLNLVAMFTRTLASAVLCIGSIFEGSKENTCAPS